jgi:His/Glu/Gln/Arg/opine family amino acid ABC transporter permease subunit
MKSAAAQAPKEHPFVGLTLTIASYAVPLALLAFLFFGAGLNFGFLNDSTNWDIISPPISFSPQDPYWRAFLVGFVNTIVAGATAMVFAVLLGFSLALLRMSGLPAIEGGVRLYSDVIRNVPVILQAMFWYAILLNLPSAREALSAGGAFISNRGIYLPWPVTPLAAGLIGLGLVMILVAVGRLRSAREKADPGRRRLSAIVLAILGAAAMAWGMARLEPAISWPVPQGRGIRDGLRIPVEFLALVLALILYRAAYIAEIFRAGFRAVSHGQIEAARSLGLSGWDTLFRIRLPQALVTILPPLTSECVLMVKITSIGILVGFPDLYSISVNASTMANRSMEALLLLVVGYLVINLCIVAVMNLLNRRISRRGRR